MPDAIICDHKSFSDILTEATRALSETMEHREAHLQAELLLANELGTSRAAVLARASEMVAPDAAERFAAKISRRKQGEPLAYILGHHEFFGLDFHVDRRVLIPRHETDELVQLVLDRSHRDAAPVIVDVGTGSGVLALTLAHHLPQASVIAADISNDALQVARLNAKRLNLESRVQFIESDLLAKVNVPFDVLVSNLPYIPRMRVDCLPREILAFEPRLALDGGEDGLAVVRRLLAQLGSHTARGAMALLEISEEQGAAALEDVRRALPNTTAILHQDLEGLDRAIEIRWDSEE
jgi:release factor glutamine methyltransferase